MSTHNRIAWWQDFILYAKDAMEFKIEKSAQEKFAHNLKEHVIENLKPGSDFLLHVSWSNSTQIPTLYYAKAVLLYGNFGHDFIAKIRENGSVNFATTPNSDSAAIGSIHGPIPPPPPPIKLLQGTPFSFFESRFIESGQRNFVFAGNGSFSGPVANLID